jgi:hypothetical protein
VFAVNPKKVLVELWRDFFSFMTANWQRCSSRCLLPRRSPLSPRGVFVDKFRRLALCVVGTIFMTIWFASAPFSRGWGDGEKVSHRF